MRKKIFLSSFFLLLILSLVGFLLSCLVAQTDAQGAFVFIVTIPFLLVVMFFTLKNANYLEQQLGVRIKAVFITKFFSLFYSLFFALAFIPFLNKVPATFMEVIGKSFELVTGKSPYQFVRERNSFPNKLKNELLREPRILNLDSIDVTFAWDEVCIFGPYTNNNQAKNILGMDWNIEERSQIYQSDSINALVFLYQGKVNNVVDLSRSIADFDKLDVCYKRMSSTFILEKKGASYLFKGK